MKSLAAIVAAAAAAVVAATGTPRQVHIAYAGNAAGRSDGMAIMWNTENATATSTVKFGTAPGVYSQSVTGLQRSYGFSTNHVVTLSDLSPNTEYYYVVGDDAGGWSSETSFVSSGAIVSKSVRGVFFSMTCAGCRALKPRWRILQGKTNEPWKVLTYGGTLARKWCLTPCRAQALNCSAQVARASLAFACRSARRCKVSCFAAVAP